MAKITRATFKSFIRKAGANLYVKVTSDFNGMTDCVESINGAAFRKAGKVDHQMDYTLGVQGVWLCGQDWFEAYEDSDFSGIRYYNCCGSGVIAIRK